MEKISSFDRSFRKKNYRSGRKKSPNSIPSSLSFSSLLEPEKGDRTELEVMDFTSVDLEDLLDEVHEAGDALKDLPTLQNVKIYKKSVSKFMKFVVKNSLETETTAGSNFNPLKKQKKYTIIRVVDEKLEQLAAGVLQNQSDKLYILEKIEEINGLIINLIK